MAMPPAAQSPTARPPVAADGLAPRSTAALMRRSPAAARAARQTAASSNGMRHVPAMVWPVSWPLPATSSTSPGPQLATAAAMACARSPISTAPGAACQHRRGGSPAGSSLRGLSSVTIHPVGAPRRDCAHHRPLAGIAVAAAAEDDDQPALACGPQRQQRLLQRVRRVGVVDEDGGTRWDGAPPAPSGPGHPRSRHRRRRHGGVAAARQHEAQGRQRVPGLEARRPAGSDRPGPPAVQPAPARWPSASASWLTSRSRAASRP